MAERERLQKLLAQAGVASRRKAEQLILAGRVTVNGRPAKLGDSARQGKDIIALDGQRISTGAGKVYLALHKPRGFVTTMEDERGRKCVAQLVEDVPGRVYPVGRLDKDSEGLLLMTNDGAFANAVAHPSTHVAKTYRVTLRPGISEEQLIRLSTGIELDGRMTAPAKARVLEQQPGRAVVEIVLYEGRNREIRRMCEALGLEVARLKRIAVGPVRLSMLPQGKYRELTKEDYTWLWSTANAQGKHRLALLMETICATGIRVSEVRYITVEAVQSGRADVSLKGKIRTILLPGKLCWKLQKYAKKQKVVSGEIFLTRNGKGLSRRQIWAEMKALCKAAGVVASKVFPHNLRHLFARTFYKVYKDVARLADVLGHSSIETTRIYLISTGVEHAHQMERLGLIS